ncbi:MAG TPA: TM2 domain-containing protein [Gemmatimonadales bacterium]|nr:TM2 domain-containing protein [Gemmatimonadales bacterium]
MTLPDAYGDDADEIAPEPVVEPEVSKRSRGVALGLSFFGGIFGLHRFYVDKPKSAVAMILTLGGLGIWYLYDLVLIAAGEFRDAEDLPVRNWGVAGITYPTIERGLGRAEQRVAVLEEELDGLRQQFNDLAERVDFAERMLAQQRSLEPGSKSRPSLPAPDSRTP